jgi:hypothetical protein
MVEEVGAERVLPVHTEHPAMFRSFGRKVVIPEKGKALAC